ncbi:MAG: hypothetical protein QGH39_08905 [Candidatus Thermoplasmatota archaeon]|nr:hypothetical protein [Candidatus Thermoplasmatota archaeon]MDP7265660.1 hypothetical protein [Candidatus Thermoplasmatota archaeon]
MNCPYCSYDWQPRKEKPLACPRCKRRLDFPRRTGDPLARANSIERGFQRTIYVMSILTPEFEKSGIIPVIIGGSAVEFYTRDWYATGDIDLAIDKTRGSGIEAIMDGFRFKRSGRMWIRDDLSLYVEFPGDVDDLDRERLMRVDSDRGHAYFIGLEDIIFDRIEAAEHWKSEGDREQAIRMAAVFYDEIDWDYLGKKCRGADSEEMLKRIKKEAEDAKGDT